MVAAGGLTFPRYRRRQLKSVDPDPSDSAWVPT